MFRRGPMFTAVGLLQIILFNTMAHMFQQYDTNCDKRNFWKNRTAVTSRRIISGVKLLFKK